MYRIPTVQSSYAQNDLGETLYNIVRLLRPRRVLEFGTLHGFSTQCIAQAVRDNGHGHLVACDLWEDYPFNHGNLPAVAKDLAEQGLSEFVSLEKLDLMVWLNRPEPFDLLHLDVSNDGEKLLRVVSALAPQLCAHSVLVFEGGSPERDAVEWMTKYGKQPMNPLDRILRFEILDSRFPSLSVLPMKEELRELKK